MSSVASLTAAYTAAHHEAIVVDRSALGMLQFRGASRLDLIQRMSTQDVLKLPSGQGAATVLTTDIGRIIDRLLLYATGDALYALTGENHAQAIARYLMRYVFFNDDFHIEDLSQQTAVLGIYGRQAQAILANLFGPAVELPLHHWRQLTLDGLAVYLHRTDPIAGEGYFVMGQAADQESLWQRLVEAGLTPADEEAFELLRIESGRPRLGRELTLDYIPLEANLWNDVSFKKGCYIGQEIIARMESRGRLAKKLLRLRPTAPVEAGMEIAAEGKAAGVITSAAVGPQGPIALGYVRTAVLNADPPPTLTAGLIELEMMKDEG